MPPISSNEIQQLRHLWQREPELRKEIDTIFINNNMESETLRRQHLLNELDEALDELLK